CCPQGSLFERIVPERESAREGTILIREAVQLHPFPRRAASRERRKSAAALYAVRWIFLLTHQFIVVFMAADPKPKQPTGNLNGNCTVMQADSDRPKTANFLQV
ncbi:MAG: hypothetical protein M0Z64_10545, partial [Nitrospiraceae bacterium]|nr:hypothetical protein [Nitrospiraceae bacterium]